jgi:hypothetical protein
MVMASLEPKQANANPSEVQPSTIERAIALSARPDPLPSWWSSLDGGLRLFLDACVGSAFRPQPWITLASALAVFGTAAGRIYAGPTGVRTNIYTIGIGQSASGKGHPLKWAQNALMQADLGRLLGGSAIASGTAMISALEISPTTLFCIDEVHELMGASMSKGGESKRYLSEINKNLLHLYTMSDGEWLGTAYANAKEKPRVPICQPCASLFGVSTPDAFWKVFSSGAALDGTLGRLLIFETDNNFPGRQERGGSDIPADVLEAVRMVNAGVPSHVHFPMGHGSSAKPNPWRVPYADKPAADHASEIADEEDALCREYCDTPLVALFGRTSEQVQKLALIRAISADPHCPHIRSRDLEWAFNVHGLIVAGMRRAIEFQMADTPTEARVKHMGNVVRQLCASHQLATSSMITRGCQKLSNSERLEALQTLMEQGDVEQIPFTGERKHGPVPRQYLWVGA